MKVLSMPQKAKNIIIKGNENTTGIITTLKNVAINCNTAFENIGVFSVIWKDGRYFSKEFTMSAGNYRLEMNNMKEYGSYRGIGGCNSRMKVSGSTKGNFCFTVKNPSKVSMITSISGIGEAAFVNESFNKVNFAIPGGITNVTLLDIYEGINLECEGKEVSVKNLSIKDSKLQAKNITVTQETVLSCAVLKVGTTADGDGKIILTSLLFENGNNHLEGKVDKKGNTLVEIKGSVDYSDLLEKTKAAATVGLCLSNSVKRYVQLAEGFVLIKAPKATAETFRPYYDDRSEAEGNPQDENPLNDIFITDKMGPEIYQSFSDAEGNTVYKAWYGLYKKGANITYGSLNF